MQEPKNESNMPGQKQRCAEAIPADQHHTEATCSGKSAGGRTEREQPSGGGYISADQMAEILAGLERYQAGVVPSGMPPQQQEGGYHGTASSMEMGRSSEKTAASSGCSGDNAFSGGFQRMGRSQPPYPQGGGQPHGQSGQCSGHTSYPGGAHRPYPYQSAHHPGNAGFGGSYPGPIPGGPMTGPGQAWPGPNAGAQSSQGPMGPNPMGQAGPSGHPGGCSCGDAGQSYGYGDPGGYFAPGSYGQSSHAGRHPKHDAWRYGQWMEVVNGIAAGQPDVEKIMGLMEGYDGQFWKGLLVGAIAAMVLTNDAVKGTITGALGSAWGIFQKDKNDETAETKNRTSEEKTQ